jgi:membrane-associated phospholipid phosphatase
MTLIYPDLFWGVLSFLGGANVTIALASALTICLFSSGDQRLAKYWIVLFGLTMLIVGATKLAFIGWGLGVESFDFTGISGHAARATAVYPVLSYMLLKHRKPALQNAAIVAAFILSIGVAGARIFWKAHSLSEVTSGFFLGAIAAVTYFQLNGSGRLLSLRYRFTWVRCAIAIAVCLPTAPTQDWIVKAGLVLSGRDHPYTRYP